MKYLLLISLMFFTACTQSTRYGQCIGLMDEAEPNLEYEVSWWNGFVAIIFAETIIIPVYTVAKDIQCPVREISGDFK
jgi:hypothetical protein